MAGQEPTHKKKRVKVVKVVNGIDHEEEIEVDDNGGDWGPREAHTLLNTKLRRVDGPAKATGKAKYAYDERPPGLLYGAVLRAPYACAKVTKIDGTKASTLPGVKAVITFGEKDLRYQGDPVAVVAATSPELAQDAIRAIAVTYKAQPFVVTRQQALKPDAAEVFAGGGRGNLRGGGRNGDPAEREAAFKSADVTVEYEFEIGMQHHACLETHGTTVDYSGGDSATVWTSTQNAHGIAGDAAGPLGLPQDAVTGICEYMGGGFGSKFSIDMPGDWACQLSKKVKAPVKFMLTRTDEFLMMGHRPGSYQKVKAGATKDGKLVALSATQYAMAGIGRGGVAGLPYIYHVPKVFREGADLHTNQDGGRAMRGPGHPAASFAMEAVMDDLAYAIGMDAIEFRKKNTGDMTYHRQMDAGAKAIGWENRPKTPGGGPLYGPFKSLKKGYGLGLATWGGGGGGQCKVDVFIKPDGSIAVQVGTQDLGTGSRTYTGAIVAEEFGLPLDAVETRIGSTKYGDANGSGGSTTTASLAPSVKDAAFKARTAFVEKVAPALSVKPDDLILKDGKISVSGRPDQSLTWKQACATLGAAGITARGEWNPSLAGGGVHGAQFAEVEVDLETGKVRVLKMAGVHDCGLPMNRAGVESQINGGMIQGLGYALLEKHVVDPQTGLMLNASLEDYKLPGCLEMPELIPLIDDGDTRNVVIGMAEPGAIPGASAIANAVYNACGVRVTSLPITPDKILDGLAKLQRGRIS